MTTVLKKTVPKPLMEESASLVPRGMDHSICIHFMQIELQCSVITQCVSFHSYYFLLKWEIPQTLSEVLTFFKFLNFNGKLKEPFLDMQCINWNVHLFNP